MKANELAEIMDTFYRIEGKSLYNDIATMLRHLQNENEALKRGNKATALLNYNKGYEDGTRVHIPFVPNPMPNPMPNPILHTRS